MTTPNNKPPSLKVLAIVFVVMMAVMIYALNRGWIMLP